MSRRELNNHNTAKKNGYFLGHSSTSEATKSITDNLITLSGARPQEREQHLLLYMRGALARQGNIRLFLQRRIVECDHMESLTEELRLDENHK